MDTRHRLKFPEEIELEQKQAELARLRSEHAASQHTLDKVKQEIRLFEKVYDQVLGQRIAELEKLEKQLRDLDGGGKNRSERKNAPSTEEWHGRLHAGDSLEEEEPAADMAKNSIKALYREVAKAIHPDLAMDNEERVRRHELMAFANRAYADDDRRALLEILREWEQGPEKIQGGDTGAELVRVIRLIARERQEILAEHTRIKELKDSDICRFKLKVDDALANHIDLLAEMAATVDLDIVKARNRLADLVGEGAPPVQTSPLQQTRRICFPTDTSCGVLYIRNRNSANYSDWQKFCAAKGCREIPAAKAVRLDVKDHPAARLSYLQHLQPNDLQSLFLYEVDDSFLDNIGHLTGLEELYLSDSTVNDDDLKKLARLKNLQRLYLYHTDITDAGLLHLYELKGLKGLTCSGNNITNEGLARLQKAIPGVKTINFGWRQKKEAAGQDSKPAHGESLVTGLPANKRKPADYDKVDDQQDYLDR